MGYLFCIAEHSEDNTAITVRRRRGDPGVSFPIEYSASDECATASMIAARKYFAARGQNVEPIDQIRDHKLERRGVGYAARVRCAPCQ